MRLLIFLFFALLVLFSAFSCKNKKEENNKQNKDKQIINVVKSRLIQEEYDIKINYKKKEDVKQKKDVVAIFFETIFDNDYVEVFVDGHLNFKDTITTDQTIGLAKEMELGKISDINEVSFRINNGRDIIIKDIKYNFLFIGYFKDSLVEVELKNSFLGYN